MLEALATRAEDEARRLCGAVVFYSRLPAPKRWLGDPVLLGQSARYFPVVGLIVGALAAATWYAAAAVLSQELAVALALGVGVWMTGAFHEDGLADTVDGLGGAWERDDALRIMKDSRVGTYGVLALIFALGFKYLALVQVPAAFVPATLLLAHGAGRVVAVSFMHTHAYVRAVGKSTPAVTKLGLGDLAFATLAGLTPLLLLPLGAVLLLIPLALVRWYFSRLLERRLGGYTGDCLGAVEQLGEVAVYLTMAAAPWAYFS